MNEQLKSDIRSIWLILLDCQENLAFSRYFYKPETEGENNYINSSHELQFIRFSLWKLAVIEIHKILSKSNNDVFSLWKFLKNIESNKYLNHRIPDEILLSWKKNLLSVEKTLKKIELLRNKVYAHTDPGTAAKKINITFDEIEEVHKVIESVIRDVYYHSFNSGIDNELIVFQRDRFDIVKVLAKERKERMREVIELAQKYGIK